MSNADSVKICGVTKESEIDELACLGVGYFGLVIGFDVDYAVTVERAAALAKYAVNGPRGTIVTKARNLDELAELVERTGAPAIQLAGFTSAKRVAKLRERFDRSRLTIMQVIHFQDGLAIEESSIDLYSEAGVDIFILDKLGDDGALGSTGESVDPAALARFREHTSCNIPVLVAGGINVANLREQMTAVGASGIDVCSSVRDNGHVSIAKVRALIEALP